MSLDRIPSPAEFPYPPPVEKPCAACSSFEEGYCLLLCIDVSPDSTCERFKEAE